MAPLCMPAAATAAPARAALAPCRRPVSCGLRIARPAGASPAAALRPAARQLTGVQLPARIASAPRAVRKVAVQATSAPVVAAATSADAPVSNTVKIASYIGFWYAFNIVFNIINKSCLNAYPCPYWISAMQLVVSGLWMSVLWVTRLQVAPKMDMKLFKALLPVALAHSIGHVTACVSFSLMAVSFAHIVKSAEPVFSVALSGPFLGIWAPSYVWASLIPIVAGCSLSAMKELSFAWAGFLFAMTSNLGMVMRNIFSKKCLSEFGKDYNLDGINMFGLLSIVSCLYCIPLALIMERTLWAGAWDKAVLSLGSSEFIKMLAFSGIFYHLYNQASYMVLGQGVSPTTFSVSNTMKRVAVVVTSVMFFRNPVSPMNWLGSAIAIFGTYLYSVATDKEKTDKAKAKEAAAKTA